MLLFMQRNEYNSSHAQGCSTTEKQPYVRLFLTVNTLNILVAFIYDVLRNRIIFTWI